MAEIAALIPSALAGVAQVGRLGIQTGPVGVIVWERAPFGVAALSVLAGKREALAAAVSSAFGIPLPDPGKRMVGPKLALTGTGPDQWRAEAVDAPADGIEAFLRAALAPHAIVVDQSHAHIIVRLSGPRARELLAAGVSIDLHPRAFTVGDAAQTMVAHIAVSIWQTAPDPVYEIAVPRSLFTSFWRWLEASALRYGLEVQDTM